LTPYAINRRDDGLLIEWDQGGHQGFFAARPLRLACPCAACIEEMTGRPVLDPATVPADVRPVSLALVGAYGLRISWSDGHGTGIYTFERLLQSCPCERCRGASRISSREL
jgi:ATP-binding protein involved in chromosome partitioning